MAFTTNLGITKLTQGQSNAHVTVNEALDNMDKALAGRLDLSLSGLSTKVLSGGESTNAVLHVTSTSVACALTVQAAVKVWVFINSGAHTVTVAVSGQATPVSVAAGAVKTLVCDGTIVRLVA